MHLRTNADVLRSHADLRKDGKLEEDISVNYASDVIMIDRHQVFQGHEGVRASARILANSFPQAKFSYERLVVEGCLGYLVWSAKTKKEMVIGVDSFWIADGKIRGQTIYYDV